MYRLSDSKGVFDNWYRVSDDEEKHFLLLSDRLEGGGFEYGQFPAHGGSLRESLLATRSNLAARIAVVSVVLEVEDWI